MLFAQAVQAIPEWIPIAGGVANLGFVVWFGWYMVTKWMPQNNAVIEKMIQEFREEAKEQREAEAERAKVSAELARSGHAAMTAVIRAVDDLRATIHAHGIVEK